MDAIEDRREGAARNARSARFPAADDEIPEPRTQVREVAAVMFSRLRGRLEMLSRSFGQTRPTITIVDPDTLSDVTG